MLLERIVLFANRVVPPTPAVVHLEHAMMRYRGLYSGLLRQGALNSENRENFCEVFVGRARIFLGAPRHQQARIDPRPPFQ